MTTCSRQGRCRINIILDMCSVCESKAYIPLQRKILASGAGVGQHPRRQNFALGIPTCWYLKTLEFALPPTRNLKFAFHRSFSTLALQKLANAKADSSGIQALRLYFSWKGVLRILI